VQGYTIGQRVGVTPNVGCGRCPSCADGRSNYCPDYSAIGINMDGSHAAHMLLAAPYVRQGNLIPLPDAVSDRAGAILEPLSCVIGGVQAVAPGVGDVVVIYGAGPMGLLHVILFSSAGAAHVIVVDVIPERLEHATNLGADVTVNAMTDSVRDALTPLTEGRGADVIVVACPAREAQEEAVGLLAPGGRLSLFGGLPTGSDPIRFDSNAVHYRNLTVTGTTGGTVSNFRTAVRLAASGKMPLEAVISDTFPFAELDAAYHKAMEGAQGKVVIVDET